MKGKDGAHGKRSERKGELLVIRSGEGQNVSSLTQGRFRQLSFWHYLISECLSLQSYCFIFISFCSFFRGSTAGKVEYSVQDIISFNTYHQQMIGQAVFCLWLN